MDARAWWCRGFVCYSLKVWCIDTVDAASCGFAGLRAALLGLFVVRGNATYECAGYDMMLWTLE